MNRFSWSIKGIGFTFLCFMLLSGCVSMPATKSNNFVSTGKLLIMPPHDVVQYGKAHPVGKGSGKQLQNSIERELKLASSYDVVVYEANDRFNFTKSTKTEDAIVEAKKMGVDYCLILSLGEFRDVADAACLIPFDFRYDFVTLKRGVLVDVNTKEEVWSLNKPFRLTGDKLGSYHSLIDRIAKAVANSLVPDQIKTKENNEDFE